MTEINRHPPVLDRICLFMDRHMEADRLYFATRSQHGRRFIDPHNALVFATRPSAVPLCVPWAWFGDCTLEVLDEALLAAPVNLAERDVVIVDDGLSTLQWNRRVVEWALDAGARRVDFVVPAICNPWHAPLEQLADFVHYDQILMGGPDGVNLFEQEPPDAEEAKRLQRLLQNERARRAECPYENDEDLKWSMPMLTPDFAQDVC